MIVGVGVDVVDVVRFARVVGRRPGMLARLFAPGELTRPDGRPLTDVSLAARFAAKEAAAKVLGAPPGMCWHDCQIGEEPSGRPCITLFGTAAAAATAAGVARWHLSLSHDGGYAVAYVIGEGG